MRFMMLMIPKGYETAEPGVKLDPKAVEAMMKYNAELQKAGVLRDLNGLHPLSMGARVSFEGGKPIVTDGPFAEAKEVLGGYWVIEVGSRAEAIDWAKRCPGGDNETIEVRQIQSMSDFPEDVQKAAEGFTEMQRAARAKPPAVNPYIFFRGNCQEAFEFYAKLLGGTIEAMIPHAGTPAAESTGPEWESKILHAALKLGDRTLMASDEQPEYATKGPGYYVNLNFAEPEEAERVFNALSEGGDVRLPLQQTFFSRKFAMLVDRFDIPWMINCT